MDEFLEDRIYDVACGADFVTHFYKDYVSFGGYSPPFNEDEYISDRDAYFFKVIVRELKAIGKYFDVEEHAVMWWNMHGEKGAPKDLKKLLKDARCIKIMYQNLYLHMRDLYKELEEE